MTGRSVAIIFCAALLMGALVGCGRSSETRDAGRASPQPAVGSRGQFQDPAASALTPTPAALTNDDWEVASRDIEKYRGVSVVLEGEVFNVLDDADGYHRFQIYTDASAKRGNTHVAVKEDPRVKRGYQVRVVGVVAGVRVAQAVSGRELRIPEVEAQSVEIIGPPSVVTPTAIASPTPEPTATTRPTASPTPAPATPTSTATRGSTATPESPTPAPTAEPTRVPTGTPAPEPTPESSPMTPPAATSAPVEGPLPLSIDAGSAQLSGAMAVTEDSGAPSGRYIESTVSDQEWDGRGDPPATGEATVQVVVPHDGEYAIWSRMWYGHVDANSYWLIVDNQPAMKVGNDASGYKSWKWVGWRDGSPSNRVTAELTAGVHTLRIVGREAGARIDQLLVTDDLDYVPR